MRRLKLPQGDNRNKLCKYGSRACRQITCVRTAAVLAPSHRADNLCYWLTAVQGRGAYHQAGNSAEMLASLRARERDECGEGVDWYVERTERHVRTSGREQQSFYN